MAIALVLGLGSCQDTGFIAPLPQDLGSFLNTTRNEQNSRFSYDGRYLVFASDRGKQRGIWLYDLVARRLIPLPGVNQPNNFQDQPDISADGRYLVYVSEQSGKSSIWFYDRQTFEAKENSGPCALTPVPARRPSGHSGESEACSVWLAHSKTTQDHHPRGLWSCNPPPSACRCHR